MLPEELTHIALGFSIRSSALEQAERRYELQIAKDESFTDITYESNWPNRLRRGKKSPQPFQALGVQKLLGRSHYLARVRAVAPHGQPGPWSDPHPFRIGSRKTCPQPPARPISPQQPLFIFTPKHKREMYRRLWRALPPKIRSRSVAKEHMNRIMEDTAQWIKTAEKTFPLFITPVHRTEAPPNLPLFEQLMAQSNDGIYGIWFAESGVKPGFATRGLRLMAKYGHVYGELGGGHHVRLRPGADEALYKLLATHNEYLLHVMKTQNARSPVAGFAATIGLWASGRMKHWGVETEWGMAKKTLGNNPEKHPPRPIDWMPPFLLGLAYGAEVYNAQIIKHAAKWDGWNPETGTLDVLWDRAIGPFYSDILKYDLIPPRRKVLENFKVALRPTRNHLRPAARKIRPFPRTKVAAAHGADGLGGEWLPNEPRWGIVPLVPTHSTHAEQQRFEAVVNPDQFETPDELQAFLQQHYPPSPTQALTVLSGDTGVITTGLETLEQIARYPERLSGPRSQRFELDLDKGPVGSFEGDVSFHEYIILKQSSDRLFLHTNDYPNETTVIELACRPEQPRIRVEPKSALLGKQFEETTGRLTLRLGHKHRCGVTRVFVESPGTL